MSFSVAAKAFFAALTRKDASDRIEAALNGGPATENCAKSLEKSPAPKKSERTNGVRSESGVGNVGGEAKTRRGAEVQPSALALLAALQREARFVDFVKEPLEGCDEATIGAAARTVRDRCAPVLERFFEIRPLTDAEEGSEISVDSDVARDSTRVRVSSAKAGGLEGGAFGRLAHSGWIAKKCATPSWSGTAEDAFVLAPMEIDVE